MNLLRKSWWSGAVSAIFVLIPMHVFAQYGANVCISVWTNRVEPSTVNVSSTRFACVLEPVTFTARIDPARSKWLDVACGRSKPDDVGSVTAATWAWNVSGNTAPNPTAGVGNAATFVNTNLGDGAVTFSASGTYTLDGQTYPFTANKSASFVVIRVGMTAYRPTTELAAYGHPFAKHEVPDDQEETPGAGIRVNGDTESSANENDLIEVQLDVAPFPVPSGLTYVLKRSSSNIKVWDSKDMSGSILLDSSEAAITISSSPMSVWVENPSGGVADLDLVARSGSTDVCSDKVHFYPFTSIVIALGGETQDPSDPADANHGIFQQAIDLYQQGYDVHMYDEDAVDYGGAGATYNEVVSAVQHRNVNQVTIYGYSHGGGSTFVLANLLNNNRGTIGTFTIPFTAYIDAVEDDDLWDSQQEHRRPPRSGFHLNYYQEGHIADGDYGLDGGPIIPPMPPGEGFEDNVDQPTPTETHATIDDEPAILNDIETSLTSRVAR